MPFLSDIVAGDTHTHIEWESCRGGRWWVVVPNHEVDSYLDANEATEEEWAERRALDAALAAQWEEYVAEEEAWLAEEQQREEDEKSLSALYEHLPLRAGMGRR